MGVTAIDRLATILAYDEGRGQPMRHAPRSGYERLEGGRTVLIADVGRPPPTRHSGAAHAGIPVLRTVERPPAHRDQLRSAARARRRSARRRAVHGGAFHRGRRRPVVGPLPLRSGALARPARRGLAHAPPRRDHAPRPGGGRGGATGRLIAQGEP
jgi:hypothetical protein